MIVTVTNETGWTPNRRWDGGETELHPVFSDTVYNATLNVQIADTVLGTPVDATITGVQYNGEYEIQYSGSNIFITGEMATYSALFGESFVFLMPDDSIKVLPYDTQEQFTTIIKWNHPTFGTANEEIVITITAEAEMSDLTVETETKTYIFTQEVSWAYESSLNIFNDLLSRGTV